MKFYTACRKQRTATTLEAHNLWKRLGGRVVLRAVQLELVEGEVVALTGANGSGKTTLLRCLAGTTRVDRGEVKWFGQPLTHWKQKQWLGLVAHDSYLYSQLTVRENLLFAARMCGVRRPEQRVAHLLEEAGLADWSERLAGRLSRGMKQRLSVARAIVHQPRILLLDEPFSGLDSVGCQWLAELLKRLQADGCSICFVTHLWNYAQRLADRILVLERGCLRQQSVSQPAQQSKQNVRAA